MSATGGSYTQIFLKFIVLLFYSTYTCRKLMKKITVTDEKIFRVYKAFDRKK